MGWAALNYHADAAPRSGTLLLPEAKEGRQAGAEATVTGGLRTYSTVGALLQNTLSTSVIPPANGGKKNPVNHASDWIWLEVVNGGKKEDLCNTIKIFKKNAMF